MAQAISNRNSRAFEAPLLDLEVARELSSRRSSMVDGRLLEVLPGKVRFMLEQRRNAVTAALQGASRTDLEEQVAALMTGYPSMRGLSKLEAQILVRKYADDLEGVPLWAIRAACKDISRGAVSDMNPDFAPSAARVRQQADEHLERFEREAKDLRAVLTAQVEPPADPEMKARIKLGFQKMQQKRSPTYVPSPEPLKPQSPSREQLEAHYSTHGLGFKSKEDSA